MKKKFLAIFAIAILTVTSVPVMADAIDSPTVAPEYHITIEGHTVSNSGTSGMQVPGGSISSSSGSITPGQEVTLTATADGGFDFSKWIINGDYIIVSGSLESGTITIIPLGDIDIDASFVPIEETEKEKSKSKSTSKSKEEAAEEESIEKEAAQNTDTSVTSPKTGVAVGGVVFVMLASGAVIIYSRRRLGEE